MKMKDVDQTRFDQLGLRKRRGHAKDRLVGEEDGAFRHRIDVTGEAQACEIVEQAVREPIVLPKPIDLLPRKLQVLKKVESLFKPCGDKKAPASGKPAHKELEYRRIRLAMIQIGLKHRQLIKVGQKSACRRMHMANPVGAATKTKQPIDLPPINSKSLPVLWPGSALELSGLPDR